MRHHRPHERAQHCIPRFQYALVSQPWKGAWLKHGGLTGLQPLDLGSFSDRARTAFSTLQRTCGASRPMHMFERAFKGIQGPV